MQVRPQAPSGARRWSRALLWVVSSQIARIARGVLGFLMAFLAYGRMILKPIV